MQYSLKNRFLGSLAFWVFYIGVGFSVTVLIALFLDRVAPGAYLIGFLPFVSVVNTISPAIFCIVTGVSAIVLAFRHEGKTPRFAYAVIGTGFVLTGIYFLTWLR